MCGRFASTLSADFIRQLFETEDDAPNLPPSWNIAPSQDALVVRRHPTTGKRRLDALRWGLVPHFTKTLKGAPKPINSRAETVATAGLFRGAFAARRCLVPAECFYEWQKVVGGKQAYAIARQDGAPLGARRDLGRLAVRGGRGRPQLRHRHDRRQCRDAGGA